MNFTYSEKNGEKPIEEWLVKNLISYAEKEHGIELNVTTTNESEPRETTSTR